MDCVELKTESRYRTPEKEKKNRRSNQKDVAVWRLRTRNPRESQVPLAGEQSSGCGRMEGYRKGQGESVTGGKCTERSREMGQELGDVITP